MMSFDSHTKTVRTIRLGARGSALSRWQAEWVAQRLRALHQDLAVEIVEIKTHGDRDLKTPLAAIGGMGLFTKEIQRSIIDGTVDLAVHSLKDLPTRNPEELILAAITPREDTADALIAPVHKTLEALPPGARVGTSAPRRRAQILFRRPDLTIVSIRGNVETRLNHAIEGRLEAVVLAYAGLKRLGLDQAVTQRLEPPDYLPAVGQGALGVECRLDDAETRRILSALDDPAARRATTAERAALAALEGGCSLPMAAWARDVATETGWDRSELALDATVFDPDGREQISVALHGPRDDPETLGRRAAERLLEQGAHKLLGHNS